MAPSNTLDPISSLSSIAIFADVPAASLLAIEKRCAWRLYESGAPIIDYLDQSSDVFFIVAGDARASIYSVDGKAVTFSDLGPGDMFGEYAAIDGAPRSVGIEARTRCRVAAMPAATFLNLIQTEPSIAVNLLRRLVTKVRVLTTRIYEFTALAVNNRIQSELLRLALLSRASGNTADIDPAPIHSDIASRTSTHREAVAREFSRLTRIGILERRGRAVRVRDIKRLTVMVHEATGE